MPSFVWKGRTRAGGTMEGVLIADSRRAAEMAVRRQNPQVISVTNVREKGREIPLIPRLPRGISEKRIAIFTRQFSVMLDAGLPLVQCLEILGEQEDNPRFAQIIEQTRSDVESGSSLAEAMSKHPKAFSNLFVSMIAAGEAGGILDVILQRLSTYIEKSVKLKNQVRAALIYPVTVIIIAIVVVLIILLKVIPVFEQLYAGMGGQLPFVTRVVIGVSNAVGRFFPFIVFVVVVGVIAIRQWHRTERGRRVLDGLLLKIPIIGELLRKVAVARFCRTLSTLTSSGVPILDGLEITARTSGNAIIEDAIMATRKSVEEGRTISEPLKQTKVFPAMVVQMINVGEQTGALDQMLSKIADFYEEEVDTAVAGLTKLIEPLMITFLGAAIGVIVASMYLPLYQFITQIG
jgi:type IV pilus assembly protein PilC